MRKADNLPPSCAVVTKSGNFNILKSSGPVQACNGTAFTVNNDCYIARFMIYPDLNLVMNSIRILNDNEILLNFGLIYFMTYSV